MSELVRMLSMLLGRSVLGGHRSSLLRSPTTVSWRTSAARHRVVTLEMLAGLYALYTHPEHVYSVFIGAAVGLAVMAGIAKLLQRRQLSLAPPASNGALGRAVVLRN